jgi:hypothetical protein
MDIMALQDRIKMLQLDLEGLKELQSVCEGRIISACIQQKVGHLEGCFVPYPSMHQSAWKSCSKHGTQSSQGLDD